MNIYDELRSGRSAEDIAAAFAAQLNEAEARIREEEEKARLAAKEAEDAKVQKEEDVKNLIAQFFTILVEHYPQFGLTAEDIDEDDYEQLATIMMALLDIEAMRYEASQKKADKTKLNVDFKLKTPRSNDPFTDFFKTFGL